MNLTQGIGYDCLNPQEKQLSDRCLQTFRQYGTTVDAGGISGRVDAMKVLGAALGDNPQVIYFNKTQLTTTASLRGGRQYRLMGTVSGSRLRTMEQELNQAVNRALEWIEEMNPMTDYDRLITLYEYLQDHVVYDHAELERVSRGGARHPESHNAYGALVQGRGVCDGIASAFCLLARHLGYRCTVASGQAAFRTQGKSDHAWNVLQVRDRFFHVDATWDVNQREVTGEYAYEYFCVDDDAIAADHTWDITTTPPCTGRELSYYFHNRCQAANLTNVEEIFRRFAKSRQNTVRVRIAEGIPVPEPATDYLANLLLQCASSVGRSGSVLCHWNGDTRCFYGQFQ